MDLSKIAKELAQMRNAQSAKRLIPNATPDYIEHLRKNPRPFMDMGDDEIAKMVSGHSKVLDDAADECYAWLTGGNMIRDLGIKYIMRPGVRWAQPQGIVFFMDDMDDPNVLWSITIPYDVFEKRDEAAVASIPVYQKR